MARHGDHHATDLSGGEQVDLYRANAIRVLARIVDASMMGTVERFLKQAIVDQNPFVASSALLAGATLNRVSRPPLLYIYVYNPLSTGLVARHYYIYIYITHSQQG